MTTTSTTNERAAAATGAPEWTIDASHSHVGFRVRHLMIAWVRGEFRELEGTVRWDAARPDATRIEVAIGTASVHTRDDKRDAHLRSADFFDAESFPKMTFTSAGGARVREGRLEIDGELGIRGTTRPVTLDVEGPTPEQRDPWGAVRIAASAKTKLKRSDFGMTWNSALETGGVLVGDEIEVEIELELVRK